MAKPAATKLRLDFAAPRRDLLAAIDAALPACGQQSGMPILSTLQVTALASGRVTVSAADLIVSCAASLLCPVHVPGSVCLPSKLFRDIVAKMGEGNISVTYDGASTTITGAGKRKATGIATIPGEDFPEMLRPAGEPVTIPAASLFAAPSRRNSPLTPNGATIRKRPPVCAQVCRASSICMRVLPRPKAAKMAARPRVMAQSTMARWCGKRES